MSTTSRAWKYTGPHDAVEVDGIGLIHRGKPFVTDVDLEDHIDFEAVAAKQDNWDPAAALKKLTVPALRELAADAGIDHAGLKKAQLITALTAPPEPEDPPADQPVDDPDDQTDDQTTDPIVKES